MPQSTTEVQTWLAGHDPLRIIPLIDPVVDAVGYAARSAYAETYWLGVIGPSALWTLRRVSAWAVAQPGGFEVGLADLARELGLGGSACRNAPLVRTLTRLVVFEMASIDEVNDTLAVRTTLPPLAQRHVRRLPAHLAERHQAEVQSGRRSEPSGRWQPTAPAAALGVSR